MLEKLLGHGGTSAVFLAQQKEPERKVAVKVFLRRADLDAQKQQEFHRRFLQEAEAASRLAHENILPIYSYGEEDGYPYIIMPYMPGGTLAAYLARRGPLSFKEAQWYLTQLAAALDFAHEHGCVHCDVKPANILLNSAGEAMLSDFGIARIARTDIAPGQTSPEQAHEILGTPDYISPEQARGLSLDGRSDVYSLGITLFFALTKRLPFHGDTSIALALLHVYEPPPSLALIRGDINLAMDRVVLKALAKQPEDRYQTAGALLAAFSAAVASSDKHATRSIDTSLLADSEFFSPVMPASTIQVKPARSQHHSGLWFIRGLIVSVALLVVVAAIGVPLFFQHEGSAKSRIIPKPVATATISSIDMLHHPFQDQADWSPSPFFYFDKQQHYYVDNPHQNESIIAPFYRHVLKDFKLTVTMRETRRQNDFVNDFQGVIFRASLDQANRTDLASYYQFSFDPYGSLEYQFQRFDKGTWVNLNEDANHDISTIVAPPGKSNTIMVEARGNSFSFYMNNTLVVSNVVDPNPKGFASGLVGFYVEGYQEEVVYSNLSIVTP
ncbi:protein kinase domain-containing protein [Dictyobacter arantiisoli]|uniref:non-specific serine/threonine protein kinase n=1 Tax=Dictyobacter arantiisoli TaxID=2014874 RepID=A0A5A5T8E6_9CHLR|nr:protein kinase [Dictyobacter arantiisoli]GCF07627.1 hypothetical protein KDI_11910 [Dictyobacter arantiisoli]